MNKSFLNQIRKSYKGRFDEISSAVIIAIPPKGEIVSLNQEAEELTGYEASELQQMRLSEIFCDEDKQRVDSLFKVSCNKIKSFRKLFEHNVIIQKRSKRKIIVDMGFKLSHLKNTPTYIFTLQDITDLKNSEQKLKQTNEYIIKQQMMLIQTSKMSALGEMASGVAHEINNPLHIIRGNCEVLELILDNEPVSIKKIKDSIQVIDKMCGRVATIVDGLRSFSRDERNDPLETVSIESIINETMLLCEKRIVNSGIKLYLPDLSHFPHIDCHPTQISQVILNLLNNAYDEVVGKSKPWIKLNITDEKMAIWISISNSGEQISKEIADHIFNPFFTTKPVGKGTGLGLSISKSIVDEHGGALEIDWQDNYTKFVVKLPKSSPSKLKSAS